MFVALEEKIFAAITHAQEHQKIPWVEMETITEFLHRGRQPNLNVGETIQTLIRPEMIPAYFIQMMKSQEVRVGQRITEKFLLPNARLV